MFRRKRTDREIVRIHKTRARRYVRMALEPEYRAKVEKAMEKEKQRKENPDYDIEELVRVISEHRNSDHNSENNNEKNWQSDDVVFSIGSLDDDMDEVRSRFEEQEEKYLQEHLAKERREYLRSVEDCLNMQTFTFGEVMKLICEVKGMKSSEVYKTAMVDRRLYSKITKDRTYTPGRDTCIALALGLRLSFEEVEPFLKKAGYAISSSSRRDIIFEYCFKNRVHDVYDVNEILEEFGEKIL